MNRRDFQSGTVAHAAGQLLGPWLELPTPAAPPTTDVALLRFSRQAMATLFELMLTYATPRAAEIAHDVLDRIDELEAQMTVYRDDSEVSRINQRAAHSAVEVEPRLFELLALAEGLTAET